jgi:hypothetical protein
MATQRITVATVVGRSGEAVVGRFRDWSAARDRRDPGLWAPEQWPERSRRAADRFAALVREHGYALPVVYFSEHLDAWSMGDVFERWLAPSGGNELLRIHADRFELFCYPLPDDEVLARSLREALRPQSLHERAASELLRFLGRLLEAEEACATVEGSAALVVLREVLGGTRLDEEVAAALGEVPPWLTDLG